MGRLRKSVAAVLLTTALALGTVSAVKMEQSNKRLLRDPDYITSVEINKAARKASEGAGYLLRVNAKPGTSSFGTIPVGDAFVPVMYLSPGQEGRPPYVEKAREDIRQAREYLRPIQKRADPNGQVQKELLEVERSIPKRYDLEKADFSSQARQLYGPIKQLDQTKMWYLDKAYSKDKYGFTTGAIGLVASVAGGAGALVEIINEIEERKKKNNLEDRSKTLAGVIAGTGFLLSLVFSISRITGYSVMNLSNNTTGSLGIIFFIVGLICLLAYLLKKH